MDSSRNSKNKQTWEKPGMVTIKPTAVWVKPTLERLSLKDAMTTVHANIHSDGAYNS